VKKITVALVTLLLAVLLSCAPESPLDQIAEVVDSLPPEYNVLVKTGDHLFVTDIVRWNYGTMYLEEGRYYEQIWLEDQEDAIWVLRRNTSTYLRSDIIRITYLKR